MRLKKWAILIYYILLFCGFGYLSYSDFVTGDYFWILFGIATLSIGYQIISFIFKNKNDGWNRSYVIADQRILGKIKFSLAISYVYIILFLLAGLSGFLEGFFLMSAFDLMVAAIISSVLVFMVAQVIQQFVN